MSRVWDAFCVASLVGIWPRFIEPKLLTTTTAEVKLKGLKRDLKALCFSDLHFHEKISPYLLRQLVKKSAAFKPDLIFFMGDFLCDSRLSSKEALKRFLREFQAPLGAFCVLGNHDYAQPVSVNDEGDYAISEKEGYFQKAFSRLSKKIVLTGKREKALENLRLHADLVATLKETPFKLLHNQSIFLKKAGLNITGLGEHMVGQAKKEMAFQGYVKEAPGVVLAHNPDVVPHLSDAPGDLILSGHTHGGQINLPWIWKKLTLMEQPQFKEGKYKMGGKTLFVSRGVGSVKPFRWYAPPEIIEMHLKAV